MNRTSRTDLTSFFEARSVAVVGASRKKGKVGREIVASLVGAGFEGPIYPVNREADEIEGLRSYPSLEAIGEAPDLVVIVVPRRAVRDVLRECGRLGARRVIVITSGFREADEEGEKLERELVEIAREHRIRMVGPNCLGIMCPKTKLNASFGGPLPPPGGIAYFSQSGSLLAAIVDKARERGVGFAKLVSMGNKADIDELEILKAFGRDPDVKVIAGYLETINDGDAFVQEAERISKEKPILLLKAGETSAGAIAASSHTGRLVTLEKAHEVVFERAGIIRCPSVTAQFDYARALEKQTLPEGAQVAIVCNAGGAGIMATDALERNGLELARFEDGTIRRLSEKLPAGANVRNPVDVLGDALADRFEHALDVVLDDPNVHGVVVLLTPHAMTETTGTAEAVVRVSKAKPGKPILASFIGASRVRDAVAILREGGIPCYDSPEFGVGALAAMAKYARWRRRPKRVVRLFPVNRRKVEKIVSQHLRLRELEIGEAEAKEVLEAYGFVVPKGMIATTADQAADFADQIGYPVVLKIWSPDIVHKAEVGGVRLGLDSRQAVMDAFDLMMYRVPKKRPDAKILGVLVEETCKRGHEFILGVIRDPRFGPLMMFGMGGVFVEVLKDVAFYLAPITAEEAKEMLLSTRTYQLVKGGPGQEGMDIDAIAEGLQRLSQLVTEFPQIESMDINPYIVGPQGTSPVAVDARVILAAPAE
ncbi:MAG: acetate--CoA ligase family protein [Planctomycetota bacterium]